MEVISRIAGWPGALKPILIRGRKRTEFLSAIKGFSVPTSFFNL